MGCVASVPHDDVLEPGGQPPPPPLHHHSSSIGAAPPNSASRGSRRRQEAAAAPISVDVALAEFNATFPRITESELALRRVQFWDTRVEGHQSCWQALKMAVLVIFAFVC